MVDKLDNKIFLIGDKFTLHIDFNINLIPF